MIPVAVIPLIIIVSFTSNKIYRHLKEPLIRRFGKEWYDELELTVEEMKRQNII